MKRRGAIVSLLLLLPAPGVGVAQPALRLAGTVMGLGDPFAVVEEAGGPQREVRVGDRLAGCSVHAIQALALMLACGDERRRLVLAGSSIDGAPATVRPTPPAVELSRSLLADPQRLVSEISFKPRVRDGVLDGYEIERLKPGGLLEGRGIAIGDVVVGIDGTGVEQPMAFMQAVRRVGEDAGAFVVQLDGGREVRVEMR